MIIIERERECLVLRSASMNLIIHILRLCHLKFGETSSLKWQYLEPLHFKFL